LIDVGCFCHVHAYEKENSSAKQGRFIYNEKWVQKQKPTRGENRINEHETNTGSRIQGTPTRNRETSDNDNEPTKTANMRRLKKGTNQEGNRWNN